MGETIARRLLGLYPAAFRERYGEGLMAMYVQRVRDARATRGALGLLGFCLRELGSLATGAVRERVRARWGGEKANSGNVEMGRGGDMGSWLRDLRIAARSLAHRPGFSLGVALVLGLGIGATTAIFTVVDAVMLRPLPYDDPSTLVAVGSLDPGAEWVDGDPALQDLVPMSFPNYLDLRERARSFEDLTAIMLAESPIEVGETDPEYLRIAGVTPGLFEMLDAAPALGRTLLPEDYLATAPRVGVITYATWQRRFGGDAGVVGRPMGVEGRPVIVGVLSQEFSPPEAFFPSDAVPEFWVGIPVDGRDSESRRHRELYLLGRLAGRTTVEQARAEVTRIAADLTVEFPEENQLDGSPLGIGVNGLHAQTVGNAGKGLGLFLGAAALLLLLAALNAATLLLARSLDRTQEFGVRMALGASRRRVVRLLVSEAGILSVIGGAFGVLLAYGGVGVFLRYAPSSIPRLGTVAVDARVLALAAAVSLGTGIGVGLLPALRLTRRGPWQALQRAGRSFAAPSSPLGGALVSAQMAVAVVLLSGAGLLFGSFMRMRTVDLGFEADGLIVVGVSLPGTTACGRPNPWVCWDLLLDELRAVPGVESVAAASNVPVQPSTWEPRLLLPGDTPETVPGKIAGYAITPGYHEIMGTELLRGRDFGRLDGPGGEPVALVNETFVRAQLGGGEAIGTIVRWSLATDSPGRRRLDLITHRSEGSDEIPLRIVGVVGDVVQTRVAEGPRPAIYVPYTQFAAFSVRAVVRTAQPTEAVFLELFRIAERLNSNDLLELGTIRDRLVSERAPLQFQAMLVGAFSLIALLLGAAGVYGALAHSVERRQRELGVRMALGANRARVLGMVLSQGMRLSMVGVALGMVASLSLSQLLSGFLFGVQPYDPATLLLVGAVMAIVSAAACLAPARRATAVSPMRVLRAE